MGKLGPRVGKQCEFTAGEWQGLDSTRPKVGFAVGGPKRPRAVEGMNCGSVAVPFKGRPPALPSGQLLDCLGTFQLSHPSSNFLVVSFGFSM